ncbi:MAG: serine/threonine protein kinase [Acidobacteria bacterium]|nr:serine/threonine protein kinase [Acidobacteriota bacterium]
MLTQVGKYLIEEKVGVGGFGTVYKGRDPFIKRAVAIKTCQSEEEEIKKRFFREAEFAGNLHHRNITTIYDFGVTDDGTPYIVQEFLTGEDLDKLARKRDPLPLRRKLEILVDVCEGLGYAHTAGIIHRDIKPSNVRILEDGTVKLMDFGIAKSMVSQSTLTQTGITLGTASYLAPEQIRGEDLDARTDLFSLGVLAYELTTGQKPFTGDHISTVLYRIMNEQPAPPSTIVPGLPRALDAIVVKLLEKDRTRRHTNCAEVKAELGAVLALLSSAPENEAPVDDMDRTVATPSAGYQTGAAPRAASRVLDTPLSPPGPLRQTQGGAADVRLRATGGAPVLPSSTEAHARESGPVLRVLLSAAVVVLAGGGGFWLYVQKKAAKPQPPSPAEASAPSVPAPAATTASSNAPATALVPSTAAPEPAPASASAPPVAVAPEPTLAPTPAGPVMVTFRSNQVATLTIDGKKKGSVPPAGTRFSVEPGKHTAVFGIPGFMTLPPVTFVVDGLDTIPVTAIFPAKGQIVLTVSPPGAEIRIDGVAQEPPAAPPFKKFLVAGQHDIVVSMPGYRTETKAIDLEEEAQNTYRFDLKKE